MTSCRSCWCRCSGVWPARNTIGDQALGDCWPHPAVDGAGPDPGLVPFHKLSQWLTYSLIEPLEWAGVPVTGLGALTGLAEYRNGGLLLDAGVLRLARTGLRWRAPGRSATTGGRVARADGGAARRVAPLVRERLGTTPRVPLAALLEGGTWAAGPVARPAGCGRAPPLAVVSDGTVF